MNLSDIQRKVLTRVVMAPTPQIAMQQTKERNFSTARDQLVDMGLLELDESGGVTLTDNGIAIGVEEHLMDESGELTEFGRQYATAKPDEAIAADAAMSGNASVYEAIQFNILNTLRSRF